MDFLANLLSLSLLASSTLCGVRVTRSSLFGYDLGGVAKGLTASEAAAKLATLQARVEAACASSRASLATYYRINVEHAVAYTVDANGYNCARVTVRMLDAEATLWDEQQALASLVYNLREGQLGASGYGRLCATARLTGDEALAKLDELDELLAGSRDERW